MDTHEEFKPEILDEELFAKPKGKGLIAKLKKLDQIAAKAESTSDLAILETAIYAIVEAVECRDHMDKVVSVMEQSNALMVEQIKVMQEHVDAYRAPRQLTFTDDGATLVAKAPQ